MTAVFVIGFTASVYAALRLLLYLLKSQSFEYEPKTDTFGYRFFFLISAIAIFLVHISWCIVNYPGSYNPDSVVQLRYFYGLEPFSAWHPPLSTLLMGGSFMIGYDIKDANLGMFIYCALQALTGALVFSFAINKIKKAGVKLSTCYLLTVFFALTPLFGCFAQFYEKDYLYTQAIVFNLAVILEIYLTRSVDKKNLILLILSSFFCIFLRNNGIYAIVPMLFALGFMVKGIDKVKVFSTCLGSILLFVLASKVIYPLAGIGATSVSEPLSPFIQMTARYVTEYEDELTAEEIEILSNNFQGIENLKNYDPRISDPVKNYYNHSDFEGYIEVFAAQFCKHPGVYFESLFNGAYGYLAPVEADMGAWVQRNYSGYMERIGLSHTLNTDIYKIYVWVWNSFRDLPFLRYLCMPGFYTWLLIISFWLLLSTKNGSSLVLLVPSIINVCVCVASPLANAMRYALPTVAAVPFIVILSLYLARREE